jgi:hypothetical protein
MFRPAQDGRGVVAPASGPQFAPKDRATRGMAFNVQRVVRIVKYFVSHFLTCLTSMAQCLRSGSSGQKR